MPSPPKSTSTRGSPMKLVLAKTHMFMARFLLLLSFIKPLKTIKEKTKKKT